MHISSKYERISMNPPTRSWSIYSRNMKFRRSHRFSEMDSRLPDRNQDLQMESLSVDGSDIAWRRCMSQEFDPSWRSQAGEFVDFKRWCSQFGGFWSDSQLHLTIMASLNSTNGEGDQVLVEKISCANRLRQCQLFLPLREVSDLLAYSQSAIGASDLAASTTPAKGLEGLGAHGEIRKRISDVKNSEDEKRRMQIGDFSFSLFVTRRGFRSGFKPFVAFAEGFNEGDRAGTRIRREQ
ncbi:hypothetical protein HHK36_019621 [Tetracentron sinense]|uniref:Uncharacterized protein n=1 Tax=Tetracentron sinense TaxID=13715 RepID=A0A835DA75_TETSI|nr:hypothetical protein HHK36_019621 [Tetracentron sinense]